MALVRRVATSLSLLLTLLLAPAFAGDRALFEPIGYSSDSRFFAFEQFGITDGAGFAYSEIYLIDLVEDSWALGTPIRVAAEDETTSLDTIRRQARQKAARDIRTLGIEVPAETLALLGDGVADPDGKTLRFGVPGYQAGAVIDETELRLDTFPATASSPCQEWFGTEPLGYALKLDDKEVHRDEALPRSRGCPLDYRLYAVLSPFYAQDLSASVAIVASYPGGLEGPDRRFLVVPLG